MTGVQTCALPISFRLSLANYLPSGKKPEQQINLLTPVAITKDNLKDAERLNEVK